MQAAKKPKKQLMIREPGGLRGEVPACGSGIVDEPYLAYLRELDPRGTSERSKSLRNALAMSRDARFNAFLTRLRDPRYKRYRLETIAKSCEISLPQFADFWQKAQHQRALVIAQDGITDVMSDIVEDARRQSGCCDRCDGYGFLFVAADDPYREIDESRPDAKPTRSCPKCQGKGMLMKAGDTDARRMLLETTGLTGKRSPVVQINQNFGGSGMESAVDKLNRIGFDPGDAGSTGPAIDAEYSESEELENV